VTENNPTPSLTEQEMPVTGSEKDLRPQWKLSPLTQVFPFLLLIAALMLAVVSIESLILKEIAILAISLLIWPPFYKTYLLYIRFYSPVPAGYRPADASFFGALPREQLSALETLGFTFAGCVSMERSKPAVTANIALFLHANKEDAAYVCNVHGSTQTKGILGFTTKFSDGVLLEVSNSRTQLVFKYPRQILNLRFPQVQTFGDLYKLHKRAREKFKGANAAVVFTADERIAAYLADAENLHRLLHQKDHKLNRAGDKYLLTIGGAFGYRLAVIWPVGFFRDKLARREAVEKCGQMGFRLNPKQGTVEPLG
jgi:hypothetical protein